MIGISIIRETTSCAGIELPKRIICIGILSLGLTGSAVGRRSKVRVQVTAENCIFPYFPAGSHGLNGQGV